MGMVRVRDGQLHVFAAVRHADDLAARHFDGLQVLDHALSAHAAFN
jgi:hypothetical protein